MKNLRHIAFAAAAILMAAGILAQSPSELRERREAVEGVVSRAAEGDPEALYQMALIYERGFDSIPQDSVLSLEYLRRSAEAGSPKGANLLGYLLMRGDGMPQDSVAGLQWIERAAEAGDPKAQSNIGYLLLESDPARAAHWLERAAEGGVAPARSMLGDLYRDGRGVLRDTLQAEACYRAAFELGLADAAYKLEDLMRASWDTLPAAGRLREGLYLYTRNAPETGVRLFEGVAADSLAADSIRARALALLGDACTRARGADYDYDKSMRLYFEAARAGNPSAEFMIGELLEIFPDALDPLLAPTDPADFSSASYWLERAAAAGIPDAAAATRRLLTPPLDPEPVTKTTP